MTVLLGPTPCHGCGVPVTVVRRPVVIYGHGSDCPKKKPHDACAFVPSGVLVETVATDRTGNHRCISA